jgi:hypothetical protein
MTFGALRRWAHTRSRFRWHHRVARALTLEARGAVFNDQLKIGACATELEIEWLARELHPWDRDLSAERQTKMFVERAVMDTVAAIQQIFEQVPEIDRIQVRVRDPMAPHEALLAGTVSRMGLEDCQHHRSPMMKLKSLGLVFPGHTSL